MEIQTVDRCVAIRNCLGLMCIGLLISYIDVTVQESFRILTWGQTPRASTITCECMMRRAVCELTKLDVDRLTAKACCDLLHSVHRGALRIRSSSLQI